MEARGICMFVQVLQMSIVLAGGDAAADLHVLLRHLLGLPLTHDLQEVRDDRGGLMVMCAQTAFQLAAEAPSSQLQLTRRP